MGYHASHLQDGTVFNRSELLFRLGGAADVIDRIVSLSVTSLSDHVPKLAEAVSCGDAGGIRYHSHTISGVAANVSAEKLRAIAARMEELAKAGSLADMGSLLDGLEAAFRSFKACTAAIEKADV